MIVYTSLQCFSRNTINLLQEIPKSQSQLQCVGGLKKNTAAWKQSNNDDDDDIIPLLAGKIRIVIDKTGTGPCAPPQQSNTNIDDNHHRSSFCDSDTA
mmetsp:Transcript_11045/g.12393  ORF Transcript_11045/g.12393 Transcript_11045/m.12393 type:complete len:98 (+) Transcript_11045:2009-2302(+)